jgi:hypothetical protein
MAKFLKRNATSGQVEEESGVVTSAGAGDVGKLPQLDAAGKLDQSVMPSGIGAETQSATATEALVAGDFVNIYDNAGTKSIRKADKSNGRRADGYVIAAVANAAVGTVYTDGMNTSRTGLTAGAIYYLDTTGNVTLTPATTAGHLHQEIGKAVTTTALIFERGTTILLA